MGTKRSLMTPLRTKGLNMNLSHRFVKFSSITNILKVASRELLQNVSQLWQDFSEYILIGEIAGFIFVHINPIHSSVAFHTKTSPLIYTANQMTGFCMECSTGLKWVKF